MKCVPFSAEIGEQDTVVGDDADGVAEEVGEGADQRRAVELLELFELGRIDDAGDDLAGVEWLAQVGADNAVDLAGVVGRLPRLAHGGPPRLDPVEVGDDPPGNGQGVAVVHGIVIGDAGDPSVDVGAAQVLGAHHLAGRRLHQRRAPEEDRALMADDDALVGHRRDIGAAGGA